MYRFNDLMTGCFQFPGSNYFSNHFSKGVDWYRRQYAAADDGQILGEATADYLARRSTHPRLRQLLPEAQMIATLRHPVERHRHVGALIGRVEGEAGDRREGAPASRRREGDPD